MDTYLNVNQIAFILKVHPLTVRRYIRDGALAAVRVGGSVRVRESDLQAFTQALAPAARPIFRLKKSVAVQNDQPFTVDDPFLRLESRGAGFGTGK
jgi:excisionase family DNA binding protein